MIVLKDRSVTKAELEIIEVSSNSNYELGQIIKFKTYCSEIRKISEEKKKVKIKFNTVRILNHREFINSLIEYEDQKYQDEISKIEEEKNDKIEVIKIPKIKN